MAAPSLDDIYGGSTNAAPPPSLDDIYNVPQNSSFADETLKAPARVGGLLAQGLGEAGQYASRLVGGDGTFGQGIRQYGENVQARNAMTPGFVAAHPAIATAGEAAEGVAKMVPYMLPAVLGPGGAAAGMAALTAEGAGSQGERSFESAKKNGMSDGDALTASLAPAAVTGIGLAAMGTASHFAKGIVGAGAKALGLESVANGAQKLLRPSLASLAGDVGSSALVDTPIMQGQAAATAQAEKMTGARPDADPYAEVLANPKAWITAAMTGSAFGLMTAASRVRGAVALSNVLEDPTYTDKTTRAKTVDALAAQMDGVDPVVRAQWRSDAMAAVHADQPIPTDNDILKPTIDKLSAQAQEQTEPPKAEDLQATAIDALSKTVTDPNAPGVMDALADVGADKGIQAVADHVDKMPEPEKPVDITPESVRAEQQAQDEALNIDHATGEITPEPQITNPLDVYKGYKDEKTATKKLAGRTDTHEVVQRDTDNKWVIKPKDVEDEARTPEVDPVKEQMVKDTIAAAPTAELHAALAGGTLDPTHRPYVEAEVAKRTAQEPIKPAAPEETKITPIASKDGVDIYRVDDKSALIHDTEEGKYTLRERGESGNTDVATFEKIGDKIQNFKTDATARDGFDREQQIQHAQALVEKIEGQKTEQPKFSRVVDGKAPEGAKLENHEIEDYAKGLAGANGPKVKVVATHTELPFEHPSDTKGALHKGTMYLVGDKLKSAEHVRETVAHEAIAHHGMRGFFGDRLNAHLDSIFKNNTRIQKYAKEWLDGNTDVIKNQNLSEKDTRYLSIEEAMARMAEEKRSFPGAKLLVAKIQDMLRSVGLHDWANKLESLTDAQAVRMLAKGDLFNRTGETSGRSIDAPRYPAFMTAWHGSPHDQDVSIKAKFSRDLTDRLSDAKEGFAKISNDFSKASFTKDDFSRTLDTLGTKIFRGLMAVDRVVDMARSSAWATPIASHLTTLDQTRRAKQAFSRFADEDSTANVKEFRKSFKSDADLQKAADVIYKSTLYQLDPHGGKDLESQWKGRGDAVDQEGAWKPTGNDPIAPAQTIEEARADLRQAYNKLTTPQKTALNNLTAHIDTVHQRLTEAVIQKLKATYGQDTEGFNKAKAEIEGQSKLQGRYFPLSRFGDTTVNYFSTDEEGVRTRTKSEKFTTAREAEAAVKAEQAAGRHATIDSDADMRGGNVNVPSAMIDKLAGIYTKKVDEASKSGAPPAEVERLQREAEEFKQDLHKIWAGTLSPNSVEGNKLQRSGLSGFSTDTLRTYADYVTKETRATANAKYNWQIADTYRAMHDVIKDLQNPDREGYTPHDPTALVKMQKLVNGLEAQDQHQNRAPINEPVKVLNKLAFASMLTSPTMWIAHMAQPLMITLPKFAAKYGFAKSSGTMYEYMKKWMSGRYADDKILAWDRDNDNLGTKVLDMVDRHREIEAELRRNIETAGITDDPQGAIDQATRVARGEQEQIRKTLATTYEGLDQLGKEMLVLRVGSMMGATELSHGYDIHDLQTGATSAEQVLDKLTHVGGYFLRNGVSGARKSSANTAFALHYKGDFLDTLQYMTKDIIDDTLYNMNPENRPEWMRTNTGRLVGQFQFFRLNTIGKTIQLSMDALGKDYAAKIEQAQGDPAKITEITQARAEARKELAFQTAVSMSLAGAAGAPLVMLVSNTATKMVGNALAWMFEDPNDPWDFWHDVSTGVHNAVGDDLANIFEKGLGAIVGADFEHRLEMGGMGAIITGDPPEGMTAGERSAWYANKMLGPSWSMIGDWRKAGDAIAAGNTGDAAKYMSPNFVKNFFKAFDLNENGVSLAGKTIQKPEDVSMYDIALQMAGINPLDVSLAKEESSYLKTISKVLSERRTGLIHDLAKATVASDYDAKEAAIDKINAWGVSQPQLKITSQELASSIKRFRGLREGTLTKKEKIIKSEYGRE